ncbi:MAG: DUF3768 domain-containing protein [Paracoccaceae bacterium]
MKAATFFKLDYFDLALRQGSDNPASQGYPHRVLTIMLASEHELRTPLNGVVMPSILSPYFL